MSQKILCIDDEPLVLHGLKRLFHRKSQPWDVTFFDDPLQAQAKLKSDLFDVIITDVNMPALDGLTLLRWIKQQEQLTNTQVIVLTGVNDHELKHQALEYGASDLLNKPVVKEDLFARINNALKVKAHEDKLVAHNKLLEQQLLHAQRMEIVGTMASGVVHDLKNLLGGIASYGNLLTSEDESKETLQEGLVDICQANERALEFIKQIHSLSKPFKQPNQTVDLGGMIGRSIDFLQTTQKTTIIWEEPKESYHVCGDETQLYQVLLNLCINASQASPENSVVTIRLESALINEDDALTDSTQPLLRWVISDNGPGIPQEMKDTLFHSFQTTNEKKGGTGLGLSVVKRVIENHSGTITFECAPNQGTTFNILLPRLCHSSPETIQAKEETIIAHA